MVTKVVLALLAFAAAVAVTSGNPAAGVPWRWIPRHPTVERRETGLPIVRFLGQDGGETRIVGGAEAEPHSIPHQVALFIDDAYFCGGSLIDEKHVLTAGHCMFGARKVEVVAGAHNIRKEEPSQVSMVSRDFTTHENYGPFFIKNDIALIRLPKAITLSAEISPVNLPAAASEKLAPGVEVTPSGWGKTKNWGPISDVLMTVTIPMGVHSECVDYYGSSVVTDNVICVDTTGGHGPCNGDSGGPLTHVEDGKPVTRGIVSFGSSAGCTSGAPAAFTDVANYVDWIEANKAK